MSLFPTFNAPVAATPAPNPLAKPPAMSVLNPSSLAGMPAMPSNIPMANYGGNLPLAASPFGHPQMPSLAMYGGMNPVQQHLAMFNQMHPLPQIQVPQMAQQQPPAGGLLGGQNPAPGAMQQPGHIPTPTDAMQAPQSGLLGSRPMMGFRGGMGGAM